MRTGWRSIPLVSVLLLVGSFWLPAQATTASPCVIDCTSLTAAPTGALGTIAAAAEQTLPQRSAGEDDDDGSDPQLATAPIRRQGVAGGRWSGLRAAAPPARCFLAASCHALRGPPR